MLKYRYTSTQLSSYLSPWPKPAMEMEIIISGKGRLFMIYHRYSSHFINIKDFHFAEAPMLQIELSIWTLKYNFFFYFCQACFSNLSYGLISWTPNCEISQRWVRQSPIDDKSTLVQVLVWWCQATSHYLKFWTNVDSNLSCHMVKLGHNELRHSHLLSKMI